MQTTASYLQHELQLDQALGKATQAGQRRDFALLLAMLGDDLLEKPGIASPWPATEARASLEARFYPGVRRPLGADELTPARSQTLSSQFHQGGLVAARLFDCLAPEPQLDRPADDKHIPHWVRAELEPRALARLQGGQVARAADPPVANADLGEVLSRFADIAQNMTEATMPA
ncbi:VC2046/SO_2500 family protein [Gallaecimonas sp. GXIMD4217]|uniref:VC2046/SO_2500 family protein n=1 Tax=Gallaecimonas sp. GXIMD4217 TaxID=3131927 RepID=UPI00311AD548